MSLPLLLALEGGDHTCFKKEHRRRQHRGRTMEGSGKSSNGFESRKARPSFREASVFGMHDIDRPEQTAETTKRVGQLSTSIVRRARPRTRGHPVHR